LTPLPDLGLPPQKKIFFLSSRSPTAPFLEHQGGRLGDNASSSEAMSSSTEVAAGGEEEEAAADSDREGGDAGRGAGGGGPLLRLALRARWEFVAVAATAAASPLPPLAPPKRARRQRRAPAVATLKEEGIAFATKGGAARGAAAASSSPPPPPPSSLLPALLPFCDILGAEALPRNASSSNPFLFLRNCAASASPHREPWLVRVHTVSKGSKLGDWRPRAVSLLAPSSRAARAWARSISRSAASSHAGRPRALLVLLNPFGGSRGAAARVWARVARPLLEGAAGIRCEVVETDSAGHAERAVRGLSLERLRALDGVVVVGGDGLFQEALNGLLAIRFGGNGGGGASLRALEASRLRLGHVPAGSTDALAWSIHGTRCPAAACLHVALGDGARLDVLALGPVPRDLLLAPPPASASAPEEGSGGGGGLSRDDAAGRSPLTPSGAATSSGGGGEGDGTCSSSPAAVPRVPPPPLPPAAEEDWPPRAAACMASCGYFGDLLALSERIRWLGPARYGVAGLFALARLRRYELRIRYLPAEEEEGEEGEADGEGGGVGGSGSAPASPRTPAAGPLLPGAVGLAFARRAAAAAAPLSPPPSCPCPSEAGWRTDEGAFSAVLLACLPCRSDRSAGGVAPDRAMADGLASLVRVRRCSRLQFLRFLVAVSRDGARVVEGAAVAASAAAAAAAAAAATAGAATEGGEEQGKKEKRRKKKSERGGGGAAALPWVSVVAVRAVTVEPLPSKSSSASCSSPRLPWNADGETLPPSGVAAVVRKGLVRVFARPQLADE